MVLFGLLPSVSLGAHSLDGLGAMAISGLSTTQAAFTRLQPTAATVTRGSGGLCRGSVSHCGGEVRICAADFGGATDLQEIS